MASRGSPASLTGSPTRQTRPLGLLALARSQPVARGAGSSGNARANTGNGASMSLSHVVPHHQLHFVKRADASLPHGCNLRETHALITSKLSNGDRSSSEFFTCADIDETLCAHGTLRISPECGAKGPCCVRHGGRGNVLKELFALSKKNAWLSTAIAKRVQRLRALRCSSLSPSGTFRVSASERGS